MKFRDFTEPQAVITRLEPKLRDEVVATLLKALVDAGRIDPALYDDVLAKMLERESGSTTGFGMGVAVPHVKHRAVDRVVAAIGISPTGIDFAAIDKKPVFTVVMLISPPEKPEEHLQAMETIFGCLQDEDFRASLRQVESVEDVMALLETQNTTPGG